MKGIVLINGGVAIVDDDDYTLWHNYPWRKRKDNYVVCTHAGKTLRLHRVIMGAPVGTEVHHIDLDPLNNTQKNLEVLSPTKHRETHSEMPYLGRRRGPAPILKATVHETVYPFDWHAIDLDYRTRGL